MEYSTFFSILFAITCAAWASVEHIRRKQAQTELEALKQKASNSKLESVWLNCTDAQGRPRTYHAFVVRDARGKLAPAPEHLRTLIASVENEGRNRELVRAPYYDILDNGNFMMLGVIYPPQ